MEDDDRPTESTAQQRRRKTLDRIRALRARLHEIPDAEERIHPEPHPIPPVDVPPPRPDRG